MEPTEPAHAEAGAGDWGSRRSDIRRRFERLVGGYDRANRLISMGLDEGWRRTIVREALAARDPRTGQSPRGGLWIDLASGTGALARALARAGVAKVLRTDLSPILLSPEHTLRGTPDLPRAASESHRLPVPDECAAGLVMGFATRHIPSLESFCREAHRALEPGGVLALLDMDLGAGRLWGPLFRFYFRRILPHVGGALTGQRDAYRWMVRTVEEGPKPADIVRVLRETGFQSAGARHLTGGAVYLVLATR
jgi:demethylmenaquinone methyltransferase/2-methoxy-6-polyprenyl-1,4-benzoquinol methylase